jgi:hypothetical protein
MHVCFLLLLSATQYAYSKTGVVSYDDRRAICDKTEYGERILCPAMILELAYNNETLELFSLFLLSIAKPLKMG